MPATVAQLDACLSDDQEIVGSTPVGGQHFFSGDREIFFVQSFSPFCKLEGQLLVSGKRMCTVLVNNLED